MKKSEKLFMLINKIDENIINEAKPEAQKPNRITIEKRAFPIKETLSFAACFAVLAVGIFAVMRFLINSPDPLDSNPETSTGVQTSNTSNGTSNSEFNNSDIEPDYSKEDLELQAILSELEPGYKVYNWFFDGVPETGEMKHFYFSETDPYGDIYYPLSDDFPQSYDEMKKLVYKYYTDYTAGVFMKYVCHAENITQRADGSYTITVEDTGREENNRNPTFIEADGKLYGRYIGRGNMGTPHFNTARVTTKTESAINFTYLHIKDGEEFDDTEGTIKYERGGWRLSYYMGWLDQNDDMALQSTLKKLTASAGEIDGIFNNMSVIDGTPDIKAGFYEYYLIPENTKTKPNGLFTVPQSCDEMEELLSKYFAKRAAEFYMSRVGKGRLTKDQNGETHIEYDNQREPIFLEIDGKMYRSSYAWDVETPNLGIDCDTAKITRKTDKSIEFWYMGYDYENWYSGGDEYAERNGAIVFEDGAWKLNYFYNAGFIPEMPNEYTDEDLELQAILETLEPGEDVRRLFAATSAHADGDEYRFILSGDNTEPDGYQYIDVSGPQERVKHPKSLDELEQMLLEFFTEEAAADYMSSVCKGTMTDNGNGTYNVTLDKNLFFPVYIEIDGKMFYRVSGASGTVKYYNTAKVVDRTADTINYTYVDTEPGGYGTSSGTIKYERGGWKFNCTMYN